MIRDIHENQFEGDIDALSALISLRLLCVEPRVRVQVCFQRLSV